MFYLSAIVFGLFSSLHCMGMCGPIALALPRIQGVSMGGVAVVYSLGRTFTYSFIGGIMGAVGYSIQWWGFQQYLSILTGILMIGVSGIYLWKKTWLTMGSGIGRMLKTYFQYFLQKRTLSSIFLLGIVNGALPCGVVYLAATASIGAGSILGSMSYMALFGFGTLPMLVALPLLRQVKTKAFSGWQKWVPLYTCLLGFLLLIRGMGIGIPFISPIQKANTVQCCSHPAVTSTCKK
ncbi:MAG: sulfite exporter TauE/SafE family protein [Cytophagaceae bacterium]|jgi:hypothetical protein|nr:sulfite exporter TauE/SafE family protein [Cytophagaceae bacterium]